MKSSPGSSHYQTLLRPNTRLQAQQAQSLPPINPVPKRSDTSSLSWLTESTEPLDLDTVELTSPLKQLNMTKVDLPKSADPEDVDRWLEEFDEAMLNKECDDDARIIRYFAMCMKKGSPAKDWWDELEASHKVSYDAAIAAIKTTFRTSTADQFYWEELKALMLSDVEGQDVDARKAWINKVRVAESLVSSEFARDDLRAITIEDNIWPETRTVVTTKIQARTPRGVLTALRLLTKNETEMIGVQMRNNKATEAARMFA
jgi:hypothetical protein